MGFAQNAEQLVLLRTIQGLVTGVVAAANALVAASTPKEHIGSAMGTLQMARWAGIAVGPVIGGLLGDAFGFRESFWITAVLLGAAGVAALLWVHEDFEPVTVAERIGFLESYRALLIAPGMVGLYALTFLRSLGSTIILPIVSLFVVNLMGTDNGAAAITGLLIGAAAFTGAISSVFLGRLGDRIGHARVMIAAALATVLFYAPQPFVTAAWQLALLQALGGFAAGGLVPSIASLMNLWTPPGNQGATYGLENSVNASARIFSPMIGAAIAVWFGMRGVFGAAAVIYMAIAVLALIVVKAAAGRGQAGVRGLAGAVGD